ncbi:MAG: peptidylprolyl isomerase [Bacteroidetes bacterium]|nr:peptidylprolyl isomerase [Bacteroidota bacterium]
MMHSLFTSLLLLVCISTTLAQSSPRAAKEILMRFQNGTQVTREEFEYVYQKNNGGYKAAARHTPEQYRDYLNLYVNFRRKVMDAESRGMDTTRSFQDELAGYIKQLSQPYLIEKEVLESLITEAYKRSQEAIRVSHILIRLGEHPSPQDTLAAYRKILALRDSLLNHGADFETLARRHSQDPSAAANGGHLSWFSVFDFIYPFETAAYQTTTGGITPPVRTRYGYHLLKVHERMATHGMRNAAHILVRWGRIYAAKDSLAAMARAHEAYQKARTGTSWEEVVTEYSDDPNSRQKGGDLGERYISVPALQDMKYRLKPGEISQPFPSEYGFHILKVNEPEKTPTLEESRAELKSLVTRDTRSQLAEQQLVDRLKKQYGYKETPATQERLLSIAGQSYVQRGFTGDSLPADLPKAVLFSYKGGNITVAQLLERIRNDRRRNMSRLSPEEALRQELNELARTTLLGYEEKQLAQKYPEFRHLTKEYRDGILLFSLTEEKVWRRAVEDSAGLRAFYNTHRDKYQGGNRVRMVEYRGSDSTQVTRLRNELQQTSNLAQIKDWYMKEDMAIRQSELVFDIESRSGQEFARMAPGYVTELSQEGNLWTVFYLVEQISPGTKSFEEAKSEVITDYQNELERRWLEELATRYPYKLNDKVLGNLFK